MNVILAIISDEFPLSWSCRLRRAVYLEAAWPLLTAGFKCRVVEADEILKEEPLFNSKVFNVLPSFVIGST